jgi:UDP-GlcNAc:undecaprenyl-phosphate/decaprenyl-phosphate GlcNAc-1-phosphate transferase
MQVEYVLTLLVAAAVTYLLTPLVRRFAIAVGASHAARDRDVHEVPTPLLGGFALYAGLVAGLIVASQLGSLKSVFVQTNMARGLLLAGALVVIMGFVDDRWGMGALSKLAGQVAAGVILVWSGAEVTWLPLPSRGYLGLTSDQQILVTILVVVMTINAVNFIDGLDGLAAGIVGIGAASFFIYYYTLTHRLGLGGQTVPALVSAVLAGICLGFLPHNFHPARIFMGDTGAMLIGLLLAYVPISSLAALDPNSLVDPHAFAHGTVNRFGAIMPLLLPAAILLIPYADLLLAVVRRTRAGLSPFAADRKHLHHRMLEIGHSHRTSVLILYLWAGLFAGSVVWLSIIRSKLFVFAIITAVAMLALLFMSMPRLRPWSRAPARAAPQAAGQAPAPAAAIDGAATDGDLAANGAAARNGAVARSGAAARNGAGPRRGRRRLTARPGPEPAQAALPGAGSRPLADGQPAPADPVAPAGGPETVRPPVPAATTPPVPAGTRPAAGGAASAPWQPASPTPQAPAVAPTVDSPPGPGVSPSQLAAPPLGREMAASPTQLIPSGSPSQPSTGLPSRPSDGQPPRPSTGPPSQPAPSAGPPWSPAPSAGPPWPPAPAAGPAWPPAPSTAPPWPPAPPVPGPPWPPAPPA